MNSRKSYFHVFTFFLLYPDRQTDGKNINTIDVYILEECAEKITSCLF